MAALTEGRHAAEFILSEGNGSVSRDAITIVSGAGKLAAGTVLGKITASGKYTASPATGSDGSQTAAAILLAPVDATSADATGVAVTRFSEVNGNTLTYDASVDDATKRGAKATQLATVGIIVR
ncbi:bacteriophage lambda head decoration protein D [Azospirillum brasilense]|uniref:Bacteriophage lambda head decoration protein D n=1 Tax=Azospirillum brasilense TaxID=192 RepID=A0A560BMW2_AZOBR|nr:head decoration protein [Azospirillum brasilense]TWA73944.1 bacteriophage lambda head decoration protein D [Azospirillum brasilense]